MCSRFMEFYSEHEVIFIEIIAKEWNDWVEKWTSGSLGSTPGLFEEFVFLMSLPFYLAFVNLLYFFMYILSLDVLYSYLYIFKAALQHLCITGEQYTKIFFVFNLVNIFSLFRSPLNNLNNLTFWMTFSLWFRLLDFYYNALISGLYYCLS